MSAKKVYLVVKTTFRDNKIVYRDTLCVCSSLKQAITHLVGVVKSESLEECVKVRFGCLSDWVLITKYRKPDLIESYEDRFFHIFEMKLNVLESKQVDFMKRAFDYINQEIYGNK